MVIEQFAKETGQMSYPLNNVIFPSYVSWLTGGYTFVITLFEVSQSKALQVIYL